jgi:hypothetical protein
MNTVSFQSSMDNSSLSGSKELESLIISEFPKERVLAICNAVQQEDPVAEQTVEYLMAYLPQRDFERRYNALYRLFEKAAWLKDRGVEPVPSDFQDSGLSERQAYRVCHWAGYALRKYRKQPRKRSIGNRIPARP